MTLTAPTHITGRMSKWTPQDLLDQRSAWALAAGQAGHSAAEVGEALGISAGSARAIMVNAGWQWWAQPRINRRWPRRSDTVAITREGEA